MTSRRAARIPRSLPVYNRKPQPWLRDRDHLDWVATLPCLRCGRRGPCVAAHIRLRGRHDGAGGRKPSDNKVCPLCCTVSLDYEGCHEIQHGGEETFWAEAQELGIADPEGVAERLWRISGDTEKGYAAIAKARPGLPTARLAA